MDERVIITGRDLDVEHQADDDRPNPKRRRPPEYVAPEADGPDLGELIDLLRVHNPNWSPEANEDAELNPDGLDGKRLAKRWRKHRITPETEAA